jgi:hypothetical protein
MAVYGDLSAIERNGTVGPGLSGITITAVFRPCSGLDTCSTAGKATSSGPSGNWSMFLPSGDFLVYSNHTRSLGGGEAVFSVSVGPVGPIHLLADPWVPYNNATLRLPDWNNLSAYASNCNAALPCKNGAPAAPYGSQVPLTSWTQDGVFYVNASLRLVFYSFLNGTVRDIAPWQPLYQNLMSYNGIEDTEWITVDGSYVYEFGCTTACMVNSTLSFYAVNVTTGRSFTTNLTGVTDLAFLLNGQVDMIGISGNMSIASFIDAKGNVYGYNIWNRTQWNLTTLPYFEANNAYWVPQLQSYFDIEASGSTSSRIDQLQLKGPPYHPSFELVSTETFGFGLPIQGVNGLVYNVTAHTLTFTAQGKPGTAITAELPINSTGVLGALTRAWGSRDTTFGAGANASAYPNVEASEHRPTLITRGLAFAGYWNGWFDNRSAFLDPSEGTFYDTNISFDHREYSPILPYHQSQLSPAALEGLFYNTTYSVIPWSVDCRTNLSACPINGNAAAPDPNGTIWWSWREGAPEFPFPAVAPVALTAPPHPPTDLNLTDVGGAFAVRWTPPIEGAAELLNYTLFYGTSSGSLDHSLSLDPWATTAVVGSIRPETQYSVLLVAWNLHWHSPGVAGTIVTQKLLGELDLAIFPADATVTVGGVPISSPGGTAAIPLAIGNYTVNVSKPRYAPMSLRATISYGNTTFLAIQLEGIAPRLEGFILPSWANLFVNGTPLPTTGNGSFLVDLTPGDWALTASAAGYLNLGPILLTMQFGDRISETLLLVRATGWLNGTVDPASATLTINGSPVPTVAGSFHLALATGSYWLSAYAPGYVPALLGPINISTGRSTEQNFTLQPVPGRWEVHVTPSDAAVTVDERRLATVNGSATELLPPGRHNLAATAVGYETYRYSAIVSPNVSTVLIVALVPTLGWIAGFVQPEGATLSVDGVPLMTGPSGSFNVSAAPGTHELRAAAAGHSDAVRIVEVIGGLTTEITVVLTTSVAGTTIPLAPPILAALLLMVAVSTGLSALMHRRRQRGRGPIDTAR